MDIEIRTLLMFTCLLGIIVCVGGFLYEKIEDIESNIYYIENQIESMPQRVCHIEENTFKITLCHIQDAVCYRAGNNYKYSFNTSVNTTYHCEEGIFYENITLSHPQNIFSPIICLITERKEVCEIK